MVESVDVVHVRGGTTGAIVGMAGIQGFGAKLGTMPTSDDSPMIPAVPPRREAPKKTTEKQQTREENKGIADDRKKSKHPILELDLPPTARMATKRKDDATIDHQRALRKNNL